MGILLEPFRNQINVAEGSALSKASWSESFTPVTGEPPEMPVFAKGALKLMANSENSLPCRY
jgi:hypothetical protein